MSLPAAANGPPVRIRRRTREPDCDETDRPQQHPHEDRVLALERVGNRGRQQRAHRIANRACEEEQDAARQRVAALFARRMDWNRAA
jgi:hypothetical protein